MRRLIFTLATLTVVCGTILTFASPAFAGTTCGSGDNAIKTSIDFGCTGQGSQPILDMLFAIIRFLTVGVGIVLVGSTVVAGLQYTTSKGDPNAVAKSKDRLRGNAIALLFFLFGFALLNFVVPGQLLK